MEKDQAEKLAIQLFDEAGFKNGDRASGRRQQRPLAATLQAILPDLEDEAPTAVVSLSITGRGQPETNLLVLERGNLRRAWVENSGEDGNLSLGVARFPDQNWHFVSVVDRVEHSHGALHLTRHWTVSAGGSLPVPLSFASETPMGAPVRAEPELMGRALAGAKGLQISDTDPEMFESPL